MCDTGNLIDLTGWEEPIKDETIIEEAAVIESTNFKGPYDPFDSMEKEACIKGLHFQDQEKPDTVADIQFEYSDQDLNNETPPVTMDFVPTNADGFKTASTCNEAHSKTLQKQVVHLNAIRNSNISTPPHPVSTKFSRNVILTENLQMIAAESPIKLIEDEPNPIPSPAPAAGSTSNLSDDTCSNTEFEARLKMLRIAMLETHPKTQKPHENHSTGQMSTTSNTQRLKVKEVEKLLHDLKSLICEHVEESKWKQFDMLMESIRCAVYSDSSRPSENGNNLSTDSPHSYKRQATFDLDLERHKQQSAEYAIARKVQEFPDAMTCSSATFDGESLASDKAATPISLPIIDTEPPQLSPPQKADSYVTEVVNDNLALQINELLERHNLTKLQMNDNDQYQYESEHNETKSLGGPTVILVVNSTAANQLPSCIVHPSTTRTNKPAAASSNTSRASTLRRRSSSLSIHDKSKQERPRSLVKQSSGDATTTINNAANPNSSQCMPLKELSVVGDKFNAMSSYRQRRNSFSVGLTAGKAGATASSIAQGRALLSGRNKAATINESNIKTNVIPIKRVTPMVKPSIGSTDVKHLNSTMPHCVGQETPMPAKSKPASKLFCTSTPMPQMRTTQQTRTLKPVGRYSNSCASTPNVRSMSYSKKATQ
ncbi:uncharacterized protein LOC117793466 [Drosophila innubila]|uniref:uncharacterized protein LOC117793466 n=1 Tax=Drosophila innubila TaxID=198719 RepID=UPI00148D42B3|nr:uncharacterized protein LOC117793466 [Drosophila innubila]